MSELPDTKNILDLFSGVGGLSYGISLADSQFKSIGGIDFESDAIQTFTNMHPQAEGVVADLSEYTPEEYSEQTGISPEDVDIICGGPPCKGFSNIRPGRSEDGLDDRNYLYQFYFDYVDYFEPEVFVMENVPQITTHTNNNGNKIFDSILERTNSIGYTSDWTLLNAAHYGVPQVRTRFFMVGQPVDSAESVTYPTPEFRIPDTVSIKHTEKLQSGDKQDPPARTIESVFKDLPVLEPGETKEEYFCDPSQLEVTKDKRYVEYLRRGDPPLTHHRASGNTETMRKRISFAGTTRDELPEYIFPSSGYKSTYSRLRRDQPSSTLTTNFTTASSTRCIHPYENRALSLREGARIQSFPDMFQFTGNKKSIRQQIGNAVPPLLGKAIGQSVVSIY
jgi:DNA (cytosine-5)-methyltransferase 1